jgi:hypothetical protein
VKRLKIENEKIPEKEGKETIVHLCCRCEGFSKCECKEKGWCYTYRKAE